ncbi:hypothetical protein [Micromonospora chersina]|nr:hypothetical protein [Micromonospora chersina]
MFDVLRQQGHAASPAALLPALAAQFGVLRAAAGSARGLARQQLLGVGAHYAEYAGWMVQEAGDGVGALALTDTAAALARAAGDDALAEYALLRRADIALYQRDGRLVVEWASRVVRGSPSPLVRGLAAQRMAQGWAVLGDASRCLSALELAIDAMAAADEVASGSGIVLGSGGGGRLMEIVRGWCYLDLGRPQDATIALEAGLSRMPAAARRARALYGVRLALSYAACGQLRRARDRGMIALDEARHVDSASVRQQLGLLAVMVRRWPGNVELNNFRMRIERELAVA